MRYLTSDTNLIADAAITATNIIPSQAFAQLARSATGGGIVRLSGSYTGSEDATFDIEVTSGDINGAPQISAPVFSGVGNGTISSIAATSAIDAQEFSVTCVSTGTATRAAWAPFQSVNLQALTTGTAGNDYTVHVSQAGLIATATDYAVTIEMAADASEFVGEAYNFGAVTLEPEGTVPESAPRIRFGDDVSVYRHWRTYRDGRYRYHFSPALRRTAKVGTRVYAITGDREVTVYDGATLTDTHTDITTLYSLLTKIQADSTLLSVDGVIADDRRPGGMACDDLTVYTASYVAGTDRDGTSYVKNAAVTVTVADAAPTETLRIECVAAPIPGAEIWSVVGSVAGALDNATTGDEYADGNYEFTIPVQLQPATEPEGEKSAFLELITRAAGEDVPSFCPKNFRLGSEAQTRTYSYEWRPRPGSTCDCTRVSVAGGPNDTLLGTTGGGTTVATIPASILSRIVTIGDWRKTSMAANATFDVGAVLLQSGDLLQGVDDSAHYYGFVQGFTEATSATFVYDDSDMRAIDLAASLYEQALYDIEATAGSFPTDAADAFDAEWSDLVAFLAELSATSPTGALAWNNQIRAAFVELLENDPGGSAANSIAVDAGAHVARALAEVGNKTTDLTPVRRWCQSSIIKIYTAAGLRHPFDGAGHQGNDVWQDHGGTHWFVSEDGLLPIQPGYYYHSARMVANPDTGEDEPVSTREFGIGPAVGCPELLRVGDRLIIKTSPFANGRATYQQGDYIEVYVIRADPVALGGGQAGDDTLTFSVRGTVVGSLADYSLVTTAPTSYSNGGLSLAITPGGIPFAPGDRWTFSAEGGEFRWRKDGGSWTTTDIAGTVSLSDGVSAQFVVGETPSFIDGDTYQLVAYAINGVGQLRSPDDGAMAWTTSQTLSVTPATSDPVECLLIAAHTIPSTATITLSASDDGFATTAFSATVPWSSGTIGYLLPASHEHDDWRLTVNTAGSIGWLYLGAGAQLELFEKGITENGTWRRRVQPATATRARSIAGEIAHNAITQASFDALLTSLEVALTDDDGRIGIVSAAGDGSFVRIDGDSLQVEDLHGFEPAASKRILSVTIPVSPV